ncbi:putative organic cation transporter protein-like [Apostichopus japonicus]|uniref:Putative organic cation transporter protein-like n=1 Tax=Stichopus japonicus TaxID=307972 RepID=A0A2G8KLJ1_STIJA|nr:putative organic cation transporter protein-like [Apostichopus japonicus]
MALDDLFIHIGELGRYQWYLFILASLDCDIYGLDHSQCEEAQRNLSIPWSKDTGYDECNMYNVTGLEFDSDGINDELDVIECQNGWKFDQRESGRTLTAKFSLVCDREVLIHVGQSLYFIGCLIGCPLFGALSDRIGRVYAWGFCITQSLVFAITMLFANNFWTYTVMRMLMAMSNYALWIIPFVYITEIVGYSKRMFVGLLVEFFWAGAYLTITLLSWILKDWMYVQIAVIGIHIISYPILFLVPESPRWLLARGNFKKAEEILTVIARRNGKEMPPNYKSELMDEAKLREQDSNPRFGHGMTYFGLTFMSGELGFPFYPSFFIQAAVEVPAYVFCIILLSYVGRRNPTSFFTTMAGVACLVSVVMRGFGLSFSAIISLIGETISPLVLVLSHWWPPFPMVFCGLLTIVGGGLVMLLPETRGTMLPETIEEAVALGRSKQRIPSEDYEEVKV